MKDMAPISNAQTGSPLQADGQSKQFDEAIKLVVDATCRACGWQGKVILYSTADEKLDACGTFCPGCGQMDYLIHFHADPVWINAKGSA